MLKHVPAAFLELSVPSVCEYEAPITPGRNCDHLDRKSPETGIARRKNNFRYYAYGGRAVIRPIGTLYCSLSLRTLSKLGDRSEGVFALVESADQHYEEQSACEQRSGRRFGRVHRHVVEGGFTRKIA